VTPDPVVSQPLPLSPPMIEGGRMAANLITQSPPSPTKDPRGPADHLTRRWLLGTILPAYGPASKRPRDTGPANRNRQPT
jgi:hypothetical protein